MFTKKQRLSPLEPEQAPPQQPTHRQATLYYIMAFLRVTTTYRKEKNMETMDFTNTAERLLLERCFWSWVREESDHHGRQDLTEWFQALIDLPASDNFVRCFSAFAAGMMEGQALAESLYQLERSGHSDKREETEGA